MSDLIWLLAWDREGLYLRGEDSIKQIFLFSSRKECNRGPIRGDSMFARFPARDVPFSLAPAIAKFINKHKQLSML